MKLRLVGLGALVAIALVACASAPVVHDPSGVDVTVTPLNENSIKTYYGLGIPYSPNPYLPWGGLITKQTFDYIVFRIQIASLHATSVQIASANAVDAKGIVVARLYDKRSFDEITQKTYIAENEYLPALKLKVEQTYFPDNGAVLTKEGTLTYAFALVGKHPLPQNLQAEVNILVGTNPAPRVFRFEVNQ